MHITYKYKIPLRTVQKEMGNRKLGIIMLCECDLDHLKSLPLQGLLLQQQY